VAGFRATKQRTGKAVSLLRAVMALGTLSV
jgi:hypothetical protein